VKSPTAVISKVGTYCFRADYSGDTNYPKSSDGNSDECFQVNPVTPTLTTSPTASVQVGQPIDDTAILTGTANEPGTPVINPTTAGLPAKGTITWNLYDVSTDATCQTSLETSTLTANGDSSATNVYKASAGMLSGSLGSSPGTTSIVPKAAGTYEWVANYGGDSPNTNANSPMNNCANSASSESVVVTPFQPVIHTSATFPPSGNGTPLGTPIDDTATLTNTTTPSNGTQGTITFNLYGPSATPMCNTAIETSVVTINGNGSYNASSGTLSGSLGSSPGTTQIIPTAAGTYYWTASYAPAIGDVNNLPVFEGCGGTNGDSESSLVIQLQPVISTAQNFIPNDSAHITVATGAGALNGTVDFQLFVNDPNCSAATGQPAFDSTPLSITGPASSGTADDRTVVTNDTVEYPTSGTTFSWLVTYTSNNPGHKGVVSNCSENSNITINN
jgi:hypothetical protein